MYEKKEFLEEEGILEHISYLYKTGYFPVTLIELCPDLSFIMSLTIVGVSLKNIWNYANFFSNF